MENENDIAHQNYHIAIRSKFVFVFLAFGLLSTGFKPNKQEEILNSFFGFCTANWKIKMNSHCAYQLNHISLCKQGVKFFFFLFFGLIPILPGLRIQPSLLAPRRY